MTLLLMFLGLVVLVLANVPIAVALGIVALAAMVATGGTAVIPNVALVLFDTVWRKRFRAVRRPLVYENTLEGKG